MKSQSGDLAAPFPWFGGKSKAAKEVWAAFGTVKNYVEPFAGSAAMLLAAPDGKRIETINDADGFIANFWRAVAHDAGAVASAADWPVNETDLLARHSWLVRQSSGLLSRLHADPDYYDAKIAGWWCWGASAWIGAEWCSGRGPWVHDGDMLAKSPAGAGRVGVSARLPSLGDKGRGINRVTGALTRREYIVQWFAKLQARMRDVRVTCGDWSRVLSPAVTTRHGLTAVFLDPPYTKGGMDYAAGGCGGELAREVQAWCIASGDNPMLRIVLCGHAGEHDALLAHGWTTRLWTAGNGYARSDRAKENAKSETLWCSPHCMLLERSLASSLDFEV